MTPICGASVFLEPFGGLGIAVAIPLTLAGGRRLFSCIVLFLFLDFSRVDPGSRKTSWSRVSVFPGCPLKRDTPAIRQPAVLHATFPLRGMWFLISPEKKNGKKKKKKKTTPTLGGKWFLIGPGVKKTTKNMPHFNWKAEILRHFRLD